MHSEGKWLGGSNVVFVPATPGALSHALHNAAANATLILSKGVHEANEVLLVDVEGLSIVSREKLVPDEPASTTIVGSSKFIGGGPLMHVKAKNFCLQHVSLELSSNSEHNADCCLLISENSEATIEHCRISAGLKHAGIEIAQNAKPKIVSCDVVRNKM